MALSNRVTPFDPSPGLLSLIPPSLKTTPPTRSRLPAAAHATIALKRAAITDLNAVRVPKNIDERKSRTTRKGLSRSSLNTLVCGFPDLAVTFQSIVRTSSPWLYSRTSAKSRPRPNARDILPPLALARTCRPAGRFTSGSDCRSFTSDCSVTSVACRGTGSAAGRTREPAPDATPVAPTVELPSVAIFACSQFNLIIELDPLDYQPLRDTGVR